MATISENIIVVEMNLSEGIVILDIENKLCENNIKIIPVKQRVEVR